MRPDFGKIIGKGNSKICYLNPNNPKTCFKASLRNNCKEILREIEFFHFLQRRNIESMYLPKYYGSFQDEEIVGYEVELFWAQDGSAMTVLEFLKIATPSQICDLEKNLDNLKNELLQKNIVFSDLAPGNLALRLDADGSITQLVMIDGFGSTEFIPISKYFTFFGRSKIQRRWKKFLSRYEIDKRRLFGNSNKAGS